MKSTFEEYKNKITRFQGDIQTLLLKEEYTYSKKVQIYYAPFDYINCNANVILTGITPGPTQLRKAVLVAQKILLQGGSDVDALRAAKSHASFGGNMRKPLVEMLDGIGLPKVLGVESSRCFWEPENPIAHFTSVLRYPVFVDGKYYGGSSPKITSPIFQRIASEFYLEEVQQIANSLNDRQLFIISLGKSANLVEKVLPKVKARGVKHIRLPHPSGENQPDLNVFLGKKGPDDYENPRSKTRAQKSLNLREAAIRTLQGPQGT